jgi:hypothetical protein
LYPEQPSDYKSILLRLHTLVSFTSIGTWVLMKLPEMQKLNAGMNQLCANIMGYLVKRDFYLIMKVNYCKFVLLLLLSYLSLTFIQQIINCNKDVKLKNNFSKF